MNRRRLPIMLFLSAMLAAGCAAAGAPSPTPEPVPTQAQAFAIRTAAAPPQACMEALISGKLVQHPASGLGIGLVGSPALAVEWPFHWSARVELGRVVLLDDAGKVVAREGDRIEMGGGQGAVPGLNAIWFTCGDLKVSRAGG